jgi:hypothetical protein
MIEVALAAVITVPLGAAALAPSTDRTRLSRAGMSRDHGAVPGIACSDIVRDRSACARCANWPDRLALDRAD